MDSLAIASRLSISSLNAQSMRIRIASENLANSESGAVSPDLAPYTRKLVTFDSTKRFSEVSGIKVKSVDLDTRPFPIQHRPGHPGADQNGYVRMPNVEPLIEIADIKEANRAYQASLQTMRQIRELVSMTIDLLKG